MKKTILSYVSVTLFILPLVSHANSRLCPFTDYFAVDAPAPAKIINAPYTLGNLSFEQQSETYFNLQCGDGNFSNGSLFIDIGYDNDNKCSLTIEDGPYVSPAVIDIQCKGRIYFNGLESSVSHSYSLKFSA